MPIAIQCAGCQRQYNIDDKLAGKTVKCKGCGAAIPVRAVLSDVPPEPDIFGIDDPNSPAPSAAPAAVKRCTSCGSPLAEGSRICLGCGLNSVTGKKTAVDIPLVGETEETRRQRKRYVRKPGNQTLEQVDELGKLAMALILFGGVVVWIVQIVKSPTGLSASSLTPVAVVLGLIAGIIAPITAIGINIVQSKLNFVPRHDTYARVALTILLPLSTSLLFGWPNLEQRFGGFITLAWLLAPFLLVYLLRGEVIDWVASVVTAAVAISLGTVLISFLASGATQITGPLYVDALPKGPWEAIAVLRPPPSDPVTQPALAATQSASPASKPGAGAIASALPPDRTDVRPAPAITPTPAAPPAEIAVVDTRQNPALAPPTAPPPDVLHTLPRPISSPFLSAVLADEPGLKGVNDVVVPSTANAHFLVVKNGETTSTVERWNISPLKKDAEATTTYFANKPSVYSLSPRGDFLATLVLFPRSQLELTYLDSRMPKKVLAMDRLQSVPSLVGFLDPIRLALRADMSAPPRTMIQFCNGLSAQPAKDLTAQPIVDDPNALALSPNGKFLAALGTDHLLAIYNLETGQGTRKIPISNNLPFCLIRLSFSPDSSQIAAYAVVADVPTIQAFKVSTGDPTSSGVVSKKPRSFEGKPMHRPGGEEAAAQPGGQPPPVNHDLLWLQDGKFWLVNGTDFLDAVSGKKVGALDLDAVIDQHLAGPDSILFVQPGLNNSRNLVLAKLNEAQLNSADNAH